MVADAAAPGRMVAAHSMPQLAAGVRLHEDRVRGLWVLLAPERVIVPDPVCLEVLHRVDGKTRFDELVAELAARHAAPPATIARDVAELLVGFHERGWLVFR
ncbi:MAG: pyrroloquinoline quinone biosynthesis peptide chaperone PqqD [Myxococcota bacterium]